MNYVKADPRESEVLDELEETTVPALGDSGGPHGRYDPYFDLSTPVNVTAVIGKSGFLSCIVRNLGNKTVRKFNIILACIS